MHHSSFRDQSGHQFGRGHIKCRIAHCYAIGGPTFFLESLDFGGVAFFDGNARADPSCRSASCAASGSAGSATAGATSSFVCIDALIHRLWTDGRMPTDLLWTPLQQELLLGELLGCIVYRPRIHCTPLDRRAVRLLGAIAAPATVARQFPANG